MRILFVTSSLSSRDGYGTYGREFVAALHGQGVEVRCIVQEASLRGAVPQDACLQSPLSHMKSVRAAYRAAKEIDRISLEWQPDVIHFGVEAYASSLVFMKTSTPSMMTAHGTYSYIPHLLYWSWARLWSLYATKVVYAKLKRIIAVSSYTKNHVLTYAGWVTPTLQQKVVVIPNGVGQVVPRTSRHNPIPKVLFVGAVKSRKGVREAVAGIGEYKKKYGPIEFHIVGSYDEGAEYVRELHAHIAQEEMVDSVVWEGGVSDDHLAELYAQSDVLLLLAISNERYFEGFGLVYLEANAHGVPVVGAKGSGAEDAIKNGSSGILISDPKNALEAADALYAVISSRETYAQGAVQWAQDHAWSKITAQYLAEYQKV